MQVKWTTSRPGEDPRNQFERVLGGLQSQPGGGSEKNSLPPCRESNPGRSARKISLYWLSFYVKQLVEGVIRL
jgi:hypothetical protein